MFCPVSVRACTDDRPACAGEPYRRHAAQRLDDTGLIGDSLCRTGDDDDGGGDVDDDDDDGGGDDVMIALLYFTLLGLIQEVN